MLDGVQVQDYNHQWLHRNMSIVGQEPTLYARSIRENIIYGLEGERLISRVGRLIRPIPLIGFVVGEGVCRHQSVRWETNAENLFSGRQRMSLEFSMHHEYMSHIMILPQLLQSELSTWIMSCDMYLWDIG